MRVQSTFSDGTVCDKNVDVKDVLRVKRLAKGKDTGNTETLRREKPRGSRNADCNLSCSGSPLFCHLSDRLLQVTAQSKCTAFNIP